MGLSIGGVFINGKILLSNISTAPVTFEGTNLTLAIPISFAGSPTTFISTNTSTIIPISFIENDSITFSNTAELTLDPAIGFSGGDVVVFTSTAELTVPISFSGPEV